MYYQTNLWIFNLAHKIHTDDIAVTGELDENPEDDDLDYIPRRKQVVSQDSDGDLSPGDLL